MISPLWNPIQEYLYKIDRAMPAVYHYTSVEGALGILGSGSLWFTERSHLNDPSEISHGIEVCKRILQENGRDNDAKRLCDNAQIVFDEFRFFSSSFSLKYYDTSQWEEYGDKGKGVMLTFKASAFDKPKQHINRLFFGNPNVIACPISYKETDLHSVLSSIIKLWDGNHIGELCDHVFMISSLFKNESWKKENEYRFFIHQKRDLILRSRQYMTRERKGELISFLDVPLQNWHNPENFPIYRITVGPKASKYLDTQIRDLIFSKGIPISEDAIMRDP